MTSVAQSPQAFLRSGSGRMVIDCRDLGFNKDTTGNAAENVLAWVMSFPEPKAMHVIIPSSMPEVRRLQCTLQGLGCAVSRVTKCVPSRL